MIINGISPFCTVLFMEMFLFSSQTEVVRWNSPWTTANSLCKLTGSHLSGEVTVDKMDLTNLPADGQSYWIGAVSIHTPWFDVFTCRTAAETDLTKRDNIKIAGNDQPVHDCHYACQNYRVFALSKSSCYCATSLVFGNACQNVRISSSSFDLYGDSSSTTRDQVPVLQYDTNAVDQRPAPYNGIGTGDCAAAILVPGNPLSSHKLMACDTKLPFICHGKLIKSSVDWANAVLQCDVVLSSVHRGLYNTTVQQETLAWTGISRRSNLYWTKDAALNEKSLFYCLAVSTSLNGEVTIAKRDCEEELPFLCEDGSLKTTTLSTTTTEDVTESTVASAVTTKTTSELRTTEQKTTNPTTQQKTTNPTTQLLSTTTSAEEKISTTGSLTTDVSQQPDPSPSSRSTENPQSTATSKASDRSTEEWQLTTLDLVNTTMNSTEENIAYQADSGYLLLVAAILAGVVLLVVIIVFCLIYKRERTKHLFSSAKKKQNTDLIYSTVKRKKCHTKELRDILDSLSDTSGQWKEKFPVDFFVNNCYDPSNDETCSDLDHWYRSSLLIQVVPDGQTHSLTITDLEPFADIELEDDVTHHTVEKEYDSPERILPSDGGYASLEDIKTWKDVHD
ncbi:uncharacterized protein LOC125669037 [Ostrea edulis]|uniref:uncharacterized protein LOC125669037 n=1 Tax=Ostrea edulis TaxID=37623 RepID=UPI0024AEB8EE|nr:uncharacterized protein LOC125669037 [Ostrea edulis]